jgi:Domain of unknown function (DUF4942)
VNAVVQADFDVVDDSAEFFAPVSSDVIDGLLGQYQAMRRKVEALGEYMAGKDTREAVHYFLEGNRTEERGRLSMERSAAQLFQLDGAIAALNAAYWSKALSLTDVLDTMPQKRRDEWHEQIRNPSGKRKDWHTTRNERDRWPERFDAQGQYLDPDQQWILPPLPDFVEATVRNTLGDLLNSRARFFSERVDGIFRGLSGEHVTNAPEAFGKRMILNYVLTSYGSTCHTKTGLINDLRCVIAKFMGRDEPKYYVSDRLVRELKGRWGEWVSVDGGAMRIRLYKKGTAHLEVHPDMAWRLNQVLAHLYPLAIPAQFRQKPKRKVKEVPLMQRPLPFAVLEILAGMKPARERCEQAWPERYREVPNTYAIEHGDREKHARAEADHVLRSLGGIPHETMIGWWVFDYAAGAVINEVVTSGCLPDQKAHQFYPTPAKLAVRAVELAEIDGDQLCLEPSAGQGGLAAFMPKDRTVCVEVSALNVKVLTSKGFAVSHTDFLKWNGGTFHRVVMNPPFDQGRWRAHLEHAAGMVRPDGRLVAILPSGAKGTELPGFECKWHGPYSNEFPGTSVDVVILVADRA